MTLTPNTCHTFSRSVSSSVHGAKTDEVWVSKPLLPQGNSAAVPPPLIVIHGADFQTSWMLDLPGAGNYYRLIRRLANYFTVYMSDLGGNLWGCTDLVQRVHDAKGYLETNYGTSGPVTLFGFSMGGLGALNYFRAYPANVKSIATIFPVIDLARFKSEHDTPGGSIDQAYQGPAATQDPYSDAVYGSLYNPKVWAATQYASHPNVPIKHWYSNTDAVIPVDTITTFVSNFPTAEAVMIGTNGHTDATVGQSADGVVEFCRKHA